MSSPAFLLRVPAALPFRALASDLVGRYVELRGGSDSDRAAFVEIFQQALDRVADGADADVEVSCIARPSGFDVALRCGGRSEVVRHPLSAVKP
jgi:hypothetical protein